MANNRIYFRCKICGNAITIAKYFPSGGWAARGDVTQMLNNMFAAHHHWKGESSYGNYQYEIHYEEEEKVDASKEAEK